MFAAVVEWAQFIQLQPSYCYNGEIGNSWRRVFWKSRARTWSTTKSDPLSQGRPQADATDAVALGPAPWWLGLVVHFCQQLFVHEKCRNGLYISFLTNNYLVSTNDELPLVVQSYQKCSTPMIGRYICVPTSATPYGSYLIVTNTIVYLQLLQARCCSNITGNDQVKTSVCRISFDGSSAKVSLFSSRNILLYWSVFGWLRFICFLTGACRF